MRHAFFIPALILICVAGAYTSAQAQSYEWDWEEVRADRYRRDILFDLAELHYPELFTSKESTVVLEVQEVVEGGDGYDPYSYTWSWFYRYYPQSNTYLAVNGKESAVYVYGPYFGPEITKAGSLDEVLRLFPSGMNSSYTNECVDVGSPEPGMNAYYGWSFTSPGPFGLPNIPNRTYGDSVVSWQPGADGGTEVLTHHGSFLNYLHLYTERELVTSHAGLNYLESSNRTYKPEEPGSVPGWYKASEATQYSPGLLLGPSSRYCIGQAWLSAPVSKSSTYSYFPTTSADPAPPASAQTETELTVSYVVSVNTPIEVQAGHFDTVEIITFDYSQGLGRRQWVDVETAILIKEDAAETYSTNDYFQPRELYRLETSGPCTLAICGGN